MEYASARVIAAFQTGGRREEMVRILVERSGQAAAQISRRLDAIAAIGHDMAASELAGGLTDLSCPVRDERGHAVAALTLPFVPRLGVQAEAAEVVPLLCAAAISISSRIGGAVEPC